MHTGTAMQARLSGVEVTYFKPSQVDTASTIHLAVDINEYLPIHSWIKIIFPDEWTMPDVPLPSKNISSEDKKELDRIVTSIYLGTSPCTSCQGLPYVKNVERDGENSIQFWTHLELKPDGPYDPIPIIVASRAGFINAKEPGSYKICVATEEESTPVCSQDIQVVRSQVEAADVRLTNDAISAVSGYNIKFNVGAGGSLDARRSKVRIRFPDGTLIPEFIEPTHIKVNGQPLSVDVNIHQPSATMSFVIPVDIAGNGAVNIEILERAGIINPDTAGDYNLSISTTYEPTVVESKPFAVKREGQKPIIIPPYTSQKASYKFAVFIQNTIEKNDLIEIVFPAKTTIPSFMSATSVLMNGNSCQLKPRTIPEEHKIQLYAPEAMEKGSIMVEFLKEAKIINPDTPGEYTISFKDQASTDYITTDPFQILIKKTEITDVKVVPFNADITATWEIKGSTSFTGDVEPGEDFAIEFPAETTLPKSIGAGTITLNGEEVKNITIEGKKVILTSPVKILSGEEFVIVIKPESGIVNPSKTSSTYKLKVTTSKDKTGGESVEFFIAPPLPKTTLLINPPKPDGKNGWYIKAPAIDFECTSETASIYMWWNWKKDQAIAWSSDGWLPMADEQRVDTLYYYAEDTYGIEEVQEFEFKIDTVAPTFTITKPIGGQSDDTVEDTYIIEGTADATELFKYDDNEKSKKVVPTITINGQKADVIQPPELGIHEPVEGEGEFRFEVEIKEGPNTFVIRAEDEAGNFLEKTIEIKKDTIAPTIEITSPEPGFANNTDEIEIKGTTEPGAILTINGDFVDVNQDGTFTYDYIVYDLKKIRHDLKYKVEDIAGNTEGEKTFTVWFGNYAVIPTNAKDLPTVNDVPGDADSVAYVSNDGNTMVPLRYLAVKLMDAQVEWDAVTRSIVIQGSDFKILYKTGQTTFTRIANGKTSTIDMKFPSEIKFERTYLPMRVFLQDGLGLSPDQIGWNAQTRTVTVSVYGKVN
ncbi:MAG: stalk domain-containing protein [Caldisericia bacterium]